MLDDAVPIMPYGHDIQFLKLVYMKGDSVLCVFVASSVYKQNSQRYEKEQNTLYRAEAKPDEVNVPFHTLVPKDMRDGAGTDNAEDHHENHDHDSFARPDFQDTLQHVADIKCDKDCSS